MEKETLDKYYKLIKKYNLKISSDGGKNIYLFCPFHDDHKASLSINKENGLFNCFSTMCRIKGNVIDFENYLKLYVS